MKKLVQISYFTVLALLSTSCGEEEEVVEECSVDGEAVSALTEGADGCESTTGSMVGQTSQTSETTKSDTENDTTVATPDDPTLTVTFSDNGRNMLVDDEGAAQITWQGDKLECSSDAGATFSDCTTSSSFEWNHANYNVEHWIVASTAGAANPESVYKFTPATQFSGKTLVVCDEEVLVSETTADFNARIAQDKTICMADGVNITGNTKIDFSFSSKSGGTIYARSGDLASFTMDASTAGIYIWSTTDITVVGVEITTDTADAVSVGGSTTTGILLSHLKIKTTNSNASGLEISNGGSAEIYDSIIDTDATPTIYTQSHSSNAWSLTAKNLTLISRFTSTADKMTSWAFTDAGGTGSVEDSTFYQWNAATGYGGAAYLVGNVGSVDLSNNTFVKMDQGSASSWAIRVHSSQGNTGVLTNTQGGNLFCAQNKLSKTWTSMVDVSTGDAQAGWSDANQSGGVIDDCPSDTDYPTP